MNIKQVFFGLAFASMTMFVACKSDSTANESVAPSTETPAADVAPQTTTPAATTVPTQDGNNAQIQVQPGAGNVQPVQVQPATQQAPAATAPAGGGSGKINPAHGQPGHSCAVPVGSPLP